MADFEPGKMNIEEQKAAYAAFWSWSIRIAIGVAVVVVLLYVFRT